MNKPRVVLVEPQNPANIGFVARALANYDITDWALVNSPPLAGSEAERTGAPARDVLHRVRICSTLEEALTGRTHVIGLTARSGKQRRCLSVTQIHDCQTEWGPDARIAWLFGREDRGLEAEEVERCTALMTIPTVGLASLNLSHAVATVLYEWFRNTPTESIPADSIRWASVQEKLRVEQKLEELLEQIRFREHPQHLKSMLRRQFAQPMEARDLRIWERILRHARWLQEDRA